MKKKPLDSICEASEVTSLHTDSSLDEDKAAKDDGNDSAADRFEQTLLQIN